MKIATLKINTQMVLLTEVCLQISKNESARGYCWNKKKMISNTRNSGECAKLIN